MTPPGLKTGPKPRFNEQDAINAALSIGLETFTLAQVAKKLGVGTSSLYRVISSRDDLVADCLKYIAKESLLEDSDCMWDQLFLKQVDLLWELFERYPGLDHTLITMPTATRYFQEFFEKFTGQLRRAGFPGDKKRMEFAIDFIFDTVVSTHYQIVAVRRHYKEIEVEEERAFFLPEPSWIERGWMDKKIHFILDGLGKGLDLTNS
ncbi:TetR/AcrR family transcriptional regulator [Corynebacterium ulcerans]|uniref:TetR/AcrR family transcriptional regulator n=1 Tax=Corynebacterium ulcerans TaxID=65058 RepID=UPI0002141B28|nr:TetR/AcrR family transcriptional regulator [Corynebacterium ulcerans]AEG84868.1 TetR family transcriptional regulator [Corynebacterium ulcerans BR-AD22]NOL57985.1 TetR/AcrR family transcriptional regulator [Corynebacterium ulcerans]NOM02616.1 TetR/AcrR family transcriptional regulator [Corynebacterium ulcerans]